MRRALNLLRAAVHYRRDAFDAGLQAAGFALTANIPDPCPGDVLVIWNRYGGFDEQARRFEMAGAAVLVAENSPLGKDFHGGRYTLAVGHVAMTGGDFTEGSSERWDGWNVQLQSWRDGDGETVILGQRGIGHPARRSPERWAESVRARIGCRIRPHPGTGDAIPLCDDLKNASAVVTWSSAAAVQALVLGVPVWHVHPDFVAAGAARPLSEWGAEPKRDDAARLAVMRRMAWCIWTLDEIRGGEPIRRLTQ